MALATTDAIVKVEFAFRVEDSAANDRAANEILHALRGS
jgi:hypothetical protein